MKTKIAAICLAFALVLAAVAPVNAGYWDREEITTYCVVGWTNWGTPIYDTIVTDCYPSFGRSCLPSRLQCFYMPF